MALALLAAFSMMLCSIYRPASRKEAFAVGLSVFAILSASTPQPEARLNKTGADAISLFSSAYAAAKLEKNQLGDYYFEFEGGRPRANDARVFLSVYDVKGQYLLKSVEVEARKVSKIQLPQGSYMLQFECDGCSRIRADLTVEKPVDAARIILGGSSIPLSVQRLFRASLIDIEDVPEHQLDAIVERYKAQK